MKLLIVLILLSGSLVGQEQAEVRLDQTSQEGSKTCYNLELRQSNSEPIMLSGQNYRLFYGSASMELDEASLSLQLDENLYTMKLVQHQNHVDGSHIGILPFDKDLGFINFSIMLDGTNTKGDYLTANNDWKSVSSLCFNISNDQLDQDIVLARPELTSEYGRAYIELSYIDNNGKIHDLPVSIDSDIHLSSK